jgi:hypothetical protein
VLTAVARIFYETVSGDYRRRSCVKIVEDNRGRRFE